MIKSACFRLLGLYQVPGIGNESHDNERLDRSFGQSDNRPQVQGGDWQREHLAQASD